MKRIPLLLAGIALSLTLSICTTVTETRPDGTVIVTKGPDSVSVVAGSQAVTSLGGSFLASRGGSYSGK